MGMAASQVRLLQLTDRKNTIGRELQHLSLQKTSLSRDMQRVTKNYQAALSSKTLKFSNNAGVTYVDLSYANLMRPSAANGNKPYLLTNASNQIIVDSKYEKYAEMISENGAAGGDYQSNRVAILSALTGISSETLTNSVATSNAQNEATQKAKDLQDQVCEKKNNEPTSNDSIQKFWSHAGNINTYDIAKLYSQSKSSISLGNSSSASQNLQSLINGIQTNMKNYLSDDDYEAFQTSCKAYQTDANGALSASDMDFSNKPYGLSKDKDNFSLDVSTMLDSIIGGYKGSTKTSDTGITLYTTRDKTSSSWQTWNTEYQALVKELEAAQTEQKSATNTNNQVLTSSQESEIAFYDQLFTAIAENGWECNDSVEDNDYLNQMLQNNQYFITTMKSAEDDKGKEYFEYDSAAASNVDNIFTVNDSNAQNEAMVQYEYEKNIINEKESRVDQRMQNLETEQSAINEMIKGIESVRNDNSERTMNIFG